MLYIAENIKTMRQDMGFTQEDIATKLNVSPQSVSKWERGETYPDISLLPTLANLFQTSIDALIEMDTINNGNARTILFQSAHAFMRSGDYSAAADILQEGIHAHPNDYDMLSDLAMALALDGSPEKLRQAITYCRRVLAGHASGKVQHTTRAALCFIYLKANEKEEALETARQLPHSRESREVILTQINDAHIRMEEINTYLKSIAIGE